MFKENFTNPLEKQKDSPEMIKYKLDRIMEDIQESVNQEFGAEVLNSDASINMRQWKRSGDLPEGYSKEDIKSNEDMVRRKKVLFSGSSDIVEGKERDEKVSAWEGRRELSKPMLLEKAVTAVFHKVLKDEFMVVRSSEFDDYENGADNIIINKETGDVVCAFDEVRESSVAVRKTREEEIDERTRTEDKQEKIKRKAKKGGTKIKYGFGSKEGKLVRQEIKEVPMFYISVQAEELDDLLEKMDYEAEKPNQTELEIFDKLLISLNEQVETLQTENLPQGVSSNLSSFKGSLSKIKNLRDKV